AEGRKLMRQDIYNGPNPNVVTGEFDVIRNGASSSYNAFQSQYRHRLTYGLQALVSYTWAHSLDDASFDANFLNVPPAQFSSSREHASSDYDIRHTFSAAISYDIPGPRSNVWKHILGSWATDSIIYIRSAPPVNVVTGQNPFVGTLLSGANSVQRPNVVPG